MISEANERFLIESINTRPSIFEESHRIYWRAFHKHIKESKIEVQVNNAFWMIDKGLLERSDFQYGGGGFKYNFWFKTLEEKETFFEDFRKIIKEIK